LKNKEKVRYTLLHLSHIRGNEKINEELMKLLIQKQKAENLPKVQFNMWKSKYNEIIDKIIQLEKKLQIPFDEKKANELMEYMIMYAPGYLERKEIEFLNQNTELNTKYGMQLLEIEKVYNEKKSITELEKAINIYVEIWKEIIEKAKG